MSRDHQRDSDDPVARVLDQLRRVQRAKHGWSACCPAHEDTNPSLSISVGSDGRILLFCHSGCTTEAIVRELGLHLSDLFSDDARRSLGHQPRPEPEPRATFSTTDAHRIWDLAHRRARDDESAEADREVYAYLDRRGLGEAWEFGLFGVLAPGVDLPAAVSYWPSSGHRVVVPLYDSSAEIVNVQSRTILRAEPKTRFPGGSQVRGSAFADRRGLEILRGGTDRWAVVFGEGLTDFLALAIASPLPVLAAPGTGFAAPAIGDWVRGRVLYSVLDNDEAGRKALSEMSAKAYALGCTKVRQALWPEDCKDACDVVARRGVAGLYDFLAAHVEKSS